VRNLRGCGHGRIVVIDGCDARRQLPDRINCDAERATVDGVDRALGNELAGGRELNNLRRLIGIQIRSIAVRH
jgi:hypothetical protein